MAGMIDAILALAALVTALACFRCVRLVERATLRPVGEAVLPASVNDSVSDPVGHRVVVEDVSPPLSLSGVSDEILAEVESRRRLTRGASSREVCSFWDEQDERDAIAEDEATLAATAVLRRR